MPSMWSCDTTHELIFVDTQTYHFLGFDPNGAQSPLKNFFKIMAQKIRPTLDLYTYNHFIVIKYIVQQTLLKQTM